MKKLKNITIQDVYINDVGVTISANSEYIIPPIEYLSWAHSSDVIVEIANGNLVVNDGTTDLTISEGVDLIKDHYFKDYYSVFGVDYNIASSYSDISLTSTYQTIYNYSGSGRLSSFLLKLDSDKIFVKLTLDTSNIIFEEEIKQLKDLVNKLDTAEFYYISTNKLFLFKPRFPLKFYSDFKIEAKSNNNKKIKSYIVWYTKVN